MGVDIAEEPWYRWLHDQVPPTVLDGATPLRLRSMGRTLPLMSSARRTRARADLQTVPQRCDERERNRPFRHPRAIEERIQPPVVGLGAALLLSLVLWGLIFNAIFDVFIHP